MSFEHIPVMLNEVLEALEAHPDGVYCDGTLGGGGHSEALLEKSGGAHGDFKREE